MNDRLQKLCRAAIATLGAVALASTARAQEVRGTVLDTNNQPVFNADFNVYDSQTGNKLTPSDKTDALGKYQLIMTNGSIHYDLLCTPVLNPPAPLVQLAPQIKRALLVNGTITVDWTLPVAVKVRGKVFDPTNSDPLSNGMAAADLDFDRVDDGSRQPAFGDITNVFGLFQAFLEAGQYTVTAFPDTTSGFAPTRLFNQSFPTANPDVDVLLMPVQRAVFLNGFVRDDTGAPVPGAVLKFDEQVNDTTFRRIPSWKHATGSDGSFHVGVAPGIYRVTVEPPTSGTPYAAIRVLNVDLSATRTQDFTVSRGVLVTGRVTDTVGQPVGQADWDAILESGPGAATPGDNTEFDGTYRFVVAPGVYRLRLTPPVSTGLDSVVFRNVSLVRDTVINVDYAALGGGGGASGSPLVRFLALDNPPTLPRSDADFRIVLNRSIASGLVEIYDVTGQRVRQIHSGPLSSGTQNFHWDGRRRQGGPARRGIYFVRVQLDGHDETRRFFFRP